MAIDPLADDVQPLAQAARSLLPPLRSGRPVSPATLWRWAAHGLRGVRLQIVRIGGTACTSKAALREFFAAVEAARSQPSPETTTPQPSPASRAAEELSALGIGPPARRVEGEP
jgi:hypothetical protein